VSSLSCDEDLTDHISGVEGEPATPEDVDPGPIAAEPEEGEEEGGGHRAEEQIAMQSPTFVEQALAEWGDEESNNQDEEVSVAFIQLFGSRKSHLCVLSCRNCLLFLNSRLRKGFVY
jgi:hypothetical protein